MLNRNRLYGLIYLISAASFSLLAYMHIWSDNAYAAIVCPVKLVTGIPCPSCGTSRAVLLLLDGQFQAAMTANPLGLLALTLLILLPAWATVDILRKKDTLLQSYRMSELFLLRHKWLLFLFAMLMAANWIWNVTKSN